MLWSDSERVARSRANAVARQAARKRGAALCDISRAAHRHVVFAWEARAEQAAYEKFLADYLDPDLWEGHRKTIQATLRYPHHANYRRDALTRLLDRLIEDGHDLTGHTVATAAALLDEDLELPADILDFALEGRNVERPNT